MLNNENIREAYSSVPTYTVLKGNETISIISKKLKYMRTVCVVAVIYKYKSTTIREDINVNLRVKLTINILFVIFSSWYLFDFKLVL